MNLVFLIIASAIIIFMFVVVRMKYKYARTIIGRIIPLHRRIPDQPSVCDESKGNMTLVVGGKVPLRFAKQFYGYNRVQVEGVISELLIQRMQLTEQLGSMQAGSVPIVTDPTTQEMTDGIAQDGGMKSQ